MRPASRHSSSSARYDAIAHELGQRAVVLRPFVVRSFKMWFGVRLLLGLLLIAAGFEPFSAGRISLGIIALSAFVSILEINLRHESALLGNLGVSPKATFAFSVIPASLGELSLALIL